MKSRISQTALSVADSAERRMDGAVSFEEIDKFIESNHGLALSLWIMLRNQVDWVVVKRAVKSADVFQKYYLKRVQMFISGWDIFASNDWVDLKSDYEHKVDPDGSEMARRGMSTKEKQKLSGTNWKEMIRGLCEAYLGMSPLDAAGLTLYEFRILCSDEHTVKNVVRVHRSKAKNDPRVKEAYDKWAKQAKAEGII
jgi:hypothetical protein